MNGVGNLGHWWTVQPVRSLTDLDKLFQYKLTFANQLGAEKVKMIEDDTNLYADADQFRIYHAKGRFRGTLCAIGTTMAASTLMNGGKNGIGFCYK